MKISKRSTRGIDFSPSSVIGTSSSTGSPTATRSTPTGTRSCSSSCPGSPPTVKQHLAAIRMMFDFLVVRQIVPFNPATSVRGPKHVVKRGKTPVLAAEQARELLDAIDTSTIAGLRDRAILAVMIYSFARVGAVCSMNVAFRTEATPAYYQLLMGLDKYGECEFDSTANVISYTLPEPVPARSMDDVDKGQLAYYGICAGCHAYNSRMIGPPTQIIQALYMDNPQGIADYAANPEKKRPDYPEMPPQSHLDEETRLAAAEFMLQVKR